MASLMTSNEVVLEKNVSANQRQRLTFWISNHSEKQHFLRTSRGTFKASLLTSHAVVLEKKSKMCLPIIV